MPYLDSQTQSETIRAAVETLQTAMKDYKSLMKDSTASRIDAGFKIGAALAEVFLLLFLPVGVLDPTDRSERQVGIWSCKIRV
jgi:hypothetical protein